MPYRIERDMVSSQGEEGVAYVGAFFGTDREWVWAFDPENAIWFQTRESACAFLNGPLCKGFGRIVQVED